MYGIPRFFIRNFRCRWLNKTWVWLDDLAGHGKFDKKANDFRLAKCWRVYRALTDGLCGSNRPDGHVHYSGTPL